MQGVDEDLKLHEITRNYTVEVSNYIAGVEKYGGYNHNPVPYRGAGKSDRSY